MKKLEIEAGKLQRFLVGKVVKQVWRHRASELGIEFTDGTRLFIDRVENGLEFSVTGTDETDA